MTLTDALRKAISTAGENRRRICLAVGINESILCRFMRGRGLRLSVADKLASYFGLELRPAKRTRKGQ